jgi:DNA-binding MarR family transcriptional regulator
MSENGGQAENSGRAQRSFRNLPSFRLHLLNALSEEYGEGVYRKLYGLKLLECRVIGITGGYGEASFKTVCREAHLDKSYASRLINRLVERGLIAKSGNSADLRAVNLVLTEEGRRVHAEMHATAVGLNQRWTSVLTEEELAMLDPLLEKLIDRMRLMMASSEPDTGAPDREDELPPAPPAEITLSETVVRQLYDTLGAALDQAAPKDRGRRGK